jgi:hypothetical protein
MASKEQTKDELQDCDEDMISSATIRIVKCVSCDKEFALTQKEVDWLREKFGADYKEPKRCKICRHAKSQGLTSSYNNKNKIPVVAAREHVTEFVNQFQNRINSKPYPIINHKRAVRN